MDASELSKQLAQLNEVLRNSLAVIRGPLKTVVDASLHDPDALPAAELYEASLTCVDLLSEVKQLLEPKPLILAEHFMWYANCKCLVTAVELGVPDVLGESRLSIEQLAEKCGARADRLKQVMRVLVADGIFDFDVETATYHNNACSILLQRNHWTGWWSWVDLYGNEFYDMARGIPQSCRKDEKRMASQIEFNTDLSMFSWFAQQGALHRVHRTLGGGAIAQAPGITTDYPWHEVLDRVIVDVGGGGGGLISALMGKFPTLRAGIFDRPEVIETATANFHSKDGIYSAFGDRVSADHLHSGSFFLPQIPSYEVYCMKFCLHDWTDAEAITILQNIRNAIIEGPKARLILLEMVIQPGRRGQIQRMGDMSVMMAAAGYEREEAEWYKLAEQSGWTINRILTLRNTWVSALELTPAPRVDKVA